MKIFAFNIPLDHPCLKILARYGDVTSAAEWLNSKKEMNAKPSLIFGRFENARELNRITDQCQARGDWCFAWTSLDVMSEIGRTTSLSLVDFVGVDFDAEELDVRMQRLMLVIHANKKNKFGIPEDIAHDLTKKQLIILKALYAAGERGLTKKALAQTIWRDPVMDRSRASGFNVHILHLRRKIQPFGLVIDFNKQDRMYRILAASAHSAATQRESSMSQALAVSH